MPRTKLRKDLQPTLAEYTAYSNLVKKEAQALLMGKRKLAQEQKSKLKDKINEYYDIIKMQLPNPNQTIGEYRLELKAKAAAAAAKAKSRRSRSCGTDEGYTSGSTSSKRRTRSQSRSRATLRDNFITPAKPPPKSYAMITPKIKPNTPQIVLRRPKHGEVAISLGGSPLMVNPVSTDTAANVNIPLNDGRLLCIQPEKGIRYSQLPRLDENVARQLQTLKENIQKICDFNDNLQC